MKARTTKSFWKHYWALPPEIRQRARQAYTIRRDNPAHPSLFFKRVKDSQPLYSVRIGINIQGSWSIQRRYGYMVLDRRAQ